MEATPFLVSLCCVIKPLITWNARDVATTLSIYYLYFFFFFLIKIFKYS